MEKNKQRIVREAAALMGQAELARRLGVSSADVASWSDGTAYMPDAMLVRLSETLLAWSGEQKFK